MALIHTARAYLVHPNLYVPNVAGAMIGDMVAVTETGYEILTEYPRDLIIY